MPKNANGKDNRVRETQLQACVKKNQDPLLTLSSGEGGRI